MTWFQWIALPILGLLVAWEFASWLRAPALWSVRLPRGLVWLAAAIAIADPDLPQRAASAVGIGRGSDLVFYLFILLFVGVSFYFYARHVRTQRQLTEVVRHLAIQEARRGGSGHGEDKPPAGQG
jgi:hypothetical protein